MMSKEITRAFESSEITELLVGITPPYLNNFVQRGTFGLKASVQAGELRAKRRLFSEDDVFGIALVWLLFESGLRTDPIIRILKEVGKTKQPNANLAANKLREANADWLIINRAPRRPSKNIPDKPEHKVMAIQQSQFEQSFSQELGASVMAIPVGRKFQDIGQRMKMLF